MIFFLPCFNSEAKGPQPAKSHRSSLAKPQKAWLPLLPALSFSMYDYSMRPSLSLSLSLYASRHIFPVCLPAFCFTFLCLSALVSLSLCLNFSSLFLFFSSNKQAYTPPCLFPCLSVCHSQRTGLAGGVQLGSTNTWLSICLLVCAGMVFLSLCCSCFLLNLLFIIWTC